MNPRIEFLIYTILILLAGVTSLMLVTDFFEARAERETYLESEEFKLPPKEVVKGEPTPLETAIHIFRERELFAQLVTPMPTPTKEITPSPTPTIEPLAQGWTIDNIIGSLAQITTGDKKRVSYKEGDGIPKTPPGAATYRLLKVDGANQRVFLQRINDGVMGWFYKNGGVEITTTPP